MTKKELQAYLKRHDLVIEGNISTWTLAMKGDINGTYHGVFKFKCYLTPTEVLSAGRDYRDLLGPSGNLAFTKEDNLAYTLSQLKHRVISAPPFWTSSLGVNGYAGDIPDENVLDAIFDAAMTSQLKYLALLQNKKDEMIKKSKETAEKILAEKEGEAIAEDVNEPAKS